MTRIQLLLFFSFFLPLVWTGMNSSIRAQVSTNCDNAIDEAGELYNIGKYDDCLQYIKNSLSSCRFSKAKKTKLYELMINANLEKDSLQGVDEGFKKLLLNEPLYTTKDYDGSDEFLMHIKNYYLIPKTGIGVRVNFLKPFIASNNEYIVLPGTSAGTYSTLSTLNAALFIDQRLTEKIGLYLDLGFSDIWYDRKLSTSYWSLYYSEQFTFIDLNLSFKFYCNTKKPLNYYFLGGLGNQFLINNYIVLDQQKKKYEAYTDALSTESSHLRFDATENIRNKYIYSLLLGAGLNYRIGAFGIGLEGRFHYAFNYLNDTQCRFFEPSLIKNYNYLDNDMRLLQLDFALTLSYYIKLRVKNKKND